MAWIVVALIIGVPIFVRKVLKGADLREFDRPTGEWFDTTQQDGPAIKQLHRQIREMLAPANSSSGMRERLALLREQMDGLSDGLVFEGRVEPVDAGGVPAEWVVASGADSARRVLMIHGGAFALGSARGHRKMSARLSQLADAAVLAIDYRLWPEFQRKHALDDIRAAYHYMTQHGPDGESAPVHTMLAGDSAGGNLVLALAAWLRDRKHAGQAARQASAVVAICPTVDSTLSGPSLIYNAHSDLLLGDIGKMLRRLPHGLVVVAASLLYRMRLPRPEYSPVFGPLHDLPPTLLHASDHDVLFSDALRYTNKARRDGSEVRLQVWRGMQHDWHLFADELQANTQAWQQVGAFLQAHCPAQRADGAVARTG